MTTLSSTTLDVANLPPFPSTWTAPSSCFATTNFYSVLLGSGYFSNMYGTPTPVLTGIWPTGDCFPPSSTPRVPFVTDGGCPAGYTLACATAGPDFSGKPMSTVTCCPSVTNNVFSFMCRDNEYGCHATATPGAVWTGVITDISLPTPTEEPVTHTPNSKEGCEAWGIKLISIAPQTSSASTVSSATGAGASAITSGTQSSSGIQSSSGTQSSPPSSGSAESAQSTSSGLSGGAIAGVAIGCIAAIAALALAAFLLYRRRQRDASSSSGTFLPPHQQQQPDVWPPEPKMVYHPGPGPQAEPLMLDSQDSRLYPNPRADREAHMLESERERWEMEG